MVAARDDEVGREKHQQAECEQLSVADAVRQLAERVGGGGVDEIHCRHHERHQGEGDAALARPEYQKGLAEPGQRERGPDAHHPPVGGAQAAEVLAAYRIPPSLGGPRRGFGHADHEERHREQAGDHGDLEDGPEVVRPEEHQGDRHERAEERADRVEGLPQAEGGPAEVGRGEVGDERVAGAPRTPSTRSSSRAVRTIPAVAATAKSGLVSAPRA